MRLFLKARGTSLMAAIGLTLVAAPAALAQSTYPDRPITFISDAPPGLSSDVATRIVAEQLTVLWKQQVVVINQPGGGGSISARAASRATPDGYTFYTPSNSTFLQLKGAAGVAPNLPIEMPRDFLPVGFISVQPMLIGVSPKLNVNSVAELIALAKEKPGDIAFAATGRGRFTHLTMELFQARAGVKLTFVPYTGGPAAAMNDVTTGRVGIIVDGYPGIGGAIEGGLVTGLGVGSQERLKEFPNLPAISETLPGFFASGWTALIAPVGTPDDILKKVSADLNKALESPDLLARFAKLGLYVNKTSLSDAGEFVKKEQETWRPILEKVASEDTSK